MRRLLSVVFWGCALAFPCAVLAQEPNPTPLPPYDPVWMWEFDGYDGDHPLEDEKARLDNFAHALKETPERYAVGYFVVYAGRRACAGEARTRAAWAKHYLVNEQEVPARRIITIDGGYREQRRLEMWIRPKKVEPPDNHSTVRPNEVRIVERCRWKIPRRMTHRAKKAGSK